MNKLFFIPVLIFILPVLLNAKEITPPDSSSQNPVLNESKSKSDIKVVDIGLDSVVTYKAREIDSDITQNITYLIGDAEVKYKKITIKAGKITVKWKENKITAEGLPDTTNGKNLTIQDSAKVNYIGLPVFSDGGEEMYGERMEFNFKTERGRVIRGRTKFQGGYYLGDAVKRMDAKVINVKNGKYTTCDKEEPHFHFAGKKMKIITGDKVIAKPVVFFIGKIPLAIIPFALFPAKEDGRQSGIIIPRFGTSPQEGRYLENMGYYWATNDYFDARFTMSFFERTGVLFKTRMNYALRYKFNGSVSGSLTRKNFPGGTRQRRWDLKVQHSQKIDPNTNFSVNASFVSNNSFYKEYSSNRSQRLNRQLVSNATFSKRWGEGKNSLTLNLSRTKDLETGSEFVTLPRLQFSRNQGAIFPFAKDKSGRSKAEPKWFNAIQYGYQGLIVNSVRKDSTGDLKADIDRRGQHDIKLTFTNPGKLFGWLTLGQNLTIDEDWFDRTQKFTQVDTNNTIETSEEKGFAARHQFSYSASASTNLYGTFYPRIGPIRALRHKMSPSVSFSYRPDFSDDFWGYFETVKDSTGAPVADTTGKPIKRDRFGGTFSGELKSLNFRLSNLFQMKIGEGEKEKKINLFNLNFSSGYNFAAESFKWQDLRTSFQANPRKNIGITMGMTHSFYKFDVDANKTVDKLLFKERGILNFLRLKQFNFDLRWSLGGRQKSPANKSSGQSAASGKPGTQSPPIEQVGASSTTKGATPQDRFAPESAFSAFDIPWRASLSFSYSVSKFNPTKPTRRAYIDLSNVELQLTKNWRIGYNIRYDIEKSEIADQRISFYRDLHCWEARFTWSPSGVGRGSFYFIVNIKAPHLRDIKIERRGGSTTIFRPF